MTWQSVIVILLFMTFTWFSVTVQSFYFPPYDYKMTDNYYMFNPQPMHELPYSFHHHGLLDTIQDAYNEYKPYVCYFFIFHDHSVNCL